MENKMYPDSSLHLLFRLHVYFSANHKLPSVSYCKGKLRIRFHARDRVPFTYNCYLGKYICLFLPTVVGIKGK